MPRLPRMARDTAGAAEGQATAPRAPEVHIHGQGSVSYVLLADGSIICIFLHRIGLIYIK